MNCTEAEIYVSALSDREGIPSAAVQHIAGCAACRGTLRDYSRMGAELRLAASVHQDALPSLPQPVERSRLNFLWRRVSVPRFALLVLLACAALSTGALSIARAQQARPLWFQFGYSLQENQNPSSYQIAKPGFDETDSTMAFLNGSPEAVTLRIEVESISPDDVVLRCRATTAKLESNGDGFTLGRSVKPSLEGVATLHYKPGQTAAIPIDGGGTVYLTGDVMDHQPKIAFGTPLEPPTGTMIVRSPVLAGPEGVLANIAGASASGNTTDQGIGIRAGSHGAYFFSAHPFRGAVQGELNWGQITFQLNGEKYRLVAAAPILGGDQPRPVWVRHDEDSEWGGHCGVCIGAGPLPK